MKIKTQMFWVVIRNKTKKIVDPELYTLKRYAMRSLEDLFNIYDYSVIKVRVDGVKP